MNDVKIPCINNQFVITTMVIFVMGMYINNILHLAQKYACPLALSVLRSEQFSKSMEILSEECRALQSIFLCVAHMVGQ